MSSAVGMRELASCLFVGFFVEFSKKDMILLFRRFLLTFARHVLIISYRDQNLVKNLLIRWITRF